MSGLMRHCYTHKHNILLGVTTARKVLPLASGIKSNLVPRLRKKPGNEVGSKVPPRDQRQHAQFAEYGAVYMILLILVPRALLMRGATRGSGQIHIRTGIWLASSNTGHCFLTMFLQYPVLDLARVRHTTRKKGSGYENGSYFVGTRCAAGLFGCIEISYSARFSKKLYFLEIDYS